MGHIFAKPKDPVTKEQRTDAIYSIPCNDCDNEYIGQTKRQFGTRLKEHQKAVFLCKKENSALSEHTCLTNHTIGWDNSKIITTTDYPASERMKFVCAVNVYASGTVRLN